MLHFRLDAAHLAQAMENGARANELRDALAAVLALPVAEKELAYLRRGIGTATRNAAWLRAERLLVLSNVRVEPPLGTNLGLYDEHTVRALLAAEKARLIAIAERMICPCCHSEEACEAAAAICEALQAA